MKKTVVLCIIMSMMLITVACGQEKVDNSVVTSADEVVAVDDAEEEEIAVSGDSEQEEEPIPGFDIPLLGGEKVNFEDFRGKKVILNFWATWCGPCVGEMPAFEKLHQEYPDLVIVAINCSEDAATVQKFIDDNGYSFMIGLDEDATIQNFFGGLTSIPVTIIIDEEGYILTGHVGASDADTMYKTYKADLGY